MVQVAETWTIRHVGPLRVAHLTQGVWPRKLGLFILGEYRIPEGT
jgi:hypothetical protein